MTQQMRLESDQDGDLPQLEDSSSEYEKAKASELSSDSEVESGQEEDPVVKQKQQQVREELTGQLDFDDPSDENLHDIHLVTPASQLKNRLKSSVEQVWTILSTEHADHG